jgi:hypothetical protein
MNRALWLSLCSGMLLAPGQVFSDTYRDTSTISAIRRIEEGLTAFKHDVGRFPSSTEGLAALRDDPGIGPAWRVPYGPAYRPLIDAWGEHLIYHHPPLYAPSEYDLYSKGINTRDDHGGVDDITSWSGIPRESYRRHPIPWTGLVLGFGFLLLLGALALGVAVGVHKVRGRSAT